MKTMWKSRYVAVAAIALLSASGSAGAQSTVAPVPAAPAPAAGNAGVGDSIQTRVENRIKELHAQLRITPAEQAQWDQFAQVMRDNARDMDQTLAERAQRFPSMNAEQNLQSYEQLAEAHAQRLHKLNQAFQSLYDAMPDQQKQVADQVFRQNAEKRAQTPAGNQSRQ
jgi:hypothetical protein